MSSVLAFMRSNLVLTIAMLASVALLIVGLLLIQFASAPTEKVSAPTAIPSEQMASEAAALEEPILDIPPLPTIDRRPPADLPTVQAALAQMGAPTEQQLTPDEVVAALAAAEPGSETWCDLLLLKADADWAIEESKLFAQRCF